MSSGQDSIAVKLDGWGDLRIEAAGHVRVTDDSTAGNGTPAAALHAEISQPGATGNILVNQHETSLLDVSGIESSGIVGQHRGQGSILLNTAGEIRATGDLSFGVSAWTHSTGTATATIAQQASGKVTVSGELTIGLYALNDGSGDARIAIHGRVDADGPMTAAAVAYANNATSHGEARVEASQSARINAQGDAAYGLWALTAGLDDASIISAAQVNAAGDDSVGLIAQTVNPSNAAEAHVSVQGGSVGASGRDARGVLVSHEGTGRASLEVAANARVSATGFGAMAAEVRGIPASGNGARATAEIAGNLSAADEFGIGAAVRAAGNDAALTIGPNAQVTGGWQADVTGTAGTHGFGAAGVAMSS